MEGYLVSKYIYIVDIGASSIKAKDVVNNKNLKIPSAIREIPKVSNISKGRGFLFEGKRILVGKLVRETVKTRSFDFWYENLPPFIYKVLSEFGCKFDGEIEVKLSVNNLYKDRVEKLQERIKEFEVNGEKIKIDKISIFLQGEAIYYPFVKANPKYEDEALFISDIGFYSLDTCYFVDGELFNPKSTQEMGFHKCIARVKPQIEAKFERDFSELQINEIVEKRAIKDIDHNELVPLDEIDEDLNIIIDSEVERYAKELRLYLKDNFLDDLMESKLHILGGGGAMQIKRVIDKVPFPNTELYLSEYGNVEWMS